MKNLNKKSKCESTLDMFALSSTEKAQLFEKSLGGMSNFIPDNRECYFCRVNLVEHYMSTGESSRSGCPRCKRSFV